MSIDYFSDLQFVCHGELKRFYDTIRRNNFDYWGLQFSNRGDFFLQIDSNPPETANSACVFVTFPGADFHYGAADPGNGIEDKIYICFTGERVKRYLAGGLLTERRTDALLRISNPEKLMRTMRSIRALLMLPYSEENHANAVLALEQLLLAMNNAAASCPRRSDWRYEAFAALTGKIAAAPELPWDFVKEARKLSVSYAHFRRLFEEFFQLPPGAFLLAARLEKAASLLSGTTLSVREIAHECGFEDEFYFSRIFKKHRTLSPSRYRENQL